MYLRAARLLVTSSRSAIAAVRFPIRSSARRRIGSTSPAGRGSGARFSGGLILPTLHESKRGARLRQEHGPESIGRLVVAGDDGGGDRLSQGDLEFRFSWSCRVQYCSG